MSKTYKFTIFKNRRTTQGELREKTFEDLYFTFKSKVKRTRETYAEYMSSSRETQAEIKDVGGFIGGVTDGNARVQGVRVRRQLLTLDIDIDRPNILQYLQQTVTFYCLIYSTHSHSPNENRFRLVAPLSREVNEDEYQALGRRIAYEIENSQYAQMKGLFDETTFQPQRLMFFPSVSSDGEYICDLLNLDIMSDEQRIIDVDKVLDTYLDRNDIYEWFLPDKVDTEQSGRNSLVNKNPLKAKGFIGAFNRTYPVSKAIEKFLPTVYTQERNGRYTFSGGTSFGGAMILNNDTLFYSHHGTDPANQYYRSAFDLVRIHKFGSYDTTYTPEKILEKDVIEKTVSFEKMIEFCKTLPEVLENTEASASLRNRLEQQEKFVENNFNDSLFEEVETPIDPDLQKKMEALKNQLFEKGILDETEIPQKKQHKKQEEPIQTVQVVQPTLVVEEQVAQVNNPNGEAWISLLSGQKSISGKLDLIFTNDKMIGKLVYYDTFRDNICFLRKPFWHKEYVEGKALEDRDMAHIRTHLDKVYDINGDKKIEDCMIVEADKIQKNKVLEHFEKLVWDNKPRLETFFEEFFDVPMNPFTRVAFKHWMVGAVSRIYRAGAPMDLLLVIKGKQGIGKSLFFKKLATLDFKKPEDHLYSDTKIDFDKAKDSYEQLEGIWIYEWKELAGMNMSEQESIKAFVDKTEDKFRRSYGRRNVELKRRVVFGGTTNEKQPLRDRSGNRRFLVMESRNDMHECYVKDENKFSQEYKDQLIAEAIVLYKNGFNPLQWTDEELQWWEKSNEDNLAENDVLGAISSFLKMKRPNNWYSMSEDEMKAFHRNYDFENDRIDSAFYNGKALTAPDKVCLQEIWRIALNQRDLQINQFHRSLINQALEKLGWVDTKKQGRFGVWGHQREIVEIKKQVDDLPF